MGEPWVAWDREASSEWASVGIAGGQLHGRQIASRRRRSVGGHGCHIFTYGGTGAGISGACWEMRRWVLGSCHEIRRVCATQRELKSRPGAVSRVPLRVHGVQGSCGEGKVLRGRDSLEPIDLVAD